MLSPSRNLLPNYTRKYNKNSLDIANIPHMGDTNYPYAALK